MEEFINHVWLQQLISNSFIQELELYKEEAKHNSLKPTKIEILKQRRKIPQKSYGSYKKKEKVVSKEEEKIINL